MNEVDQVLASDGLNPLSLNPTAFPSVEGTTAGLTAEQSKTTKGKKKGSGGGFQTMGLNNHILRAIVKKGYACPTPIQRKAIPILLQGRDVVAMARTGSGKSAAYLLPMLHTLGTHSGTVGIRGVVLSPTRELALQTVRFCKELGRFTGLKNCLVVGGGALEQQFTDLAGNPDIVIATPGRLLHIIHESHLELKLVKVIIFDEGDRLFEMGFQAQILEILKRVPEHCQRALFSATMPAVVAEFASAGLVNPVLVRLDADIRISDELTLSFFVMREDERAPILYYLLDDVIRVRDGESQVAVFVPTKYHVDFYQTLLQEHNITSSVVHGTMDQEARKESMANFYNRRTFVLIVTDVAARGLDIPLLDYVINVSFPSTEKLFIHRVGRVARAGRAGKAFSFVGHDEVPYCLDVHLGLHRVLQNEKKEGDLAKEVNYVGTVPPEVIRRHAEILRRSLLANAELLQLEKTAENGYKQYKKTRPPASRMSVMASKAFLEKTGVHPEFSAKQSSVLMERAHAVQEVSKFRGGGTIFQIQDGRQSEFHKDKFEESRKFIEHAQKVKENRLAQQQGEPTVAASTTNASSPQSLRQRLVQRSKKRHEEGSSLLPTELPRGESRNADAEYFISYAPDRSQQAAMEREGNQGFAEATLDVGADTAEGIQSKRNVYIWNQKSHKYVKQNVNTAKLLTRGLKNEAGSRVNIKTDRKTYKKWAEKSKLRIQEVGEEEDGRAMRRHQKRGRYAQVEGGDGEGEGEDSHANDFGPSNNPPQRRKGPGGKMVRVSKEQLERERKKRARKDHQKMRQFHRN